MNGQARGRNKSQEQTRNTAARSGTAPPDEAAPLRTPEHPNPKELSKPAHSYSYTQLSFKNSIPALDQNPIGKGGQY